MRTPNCIWKELSKRSIYNSFLKIEEDMEDIIDVI